MKITDIVILTAVKHLTATVSYDVITRVGVEMYKVLQYDLMNPSSAEVGGQKYQRKSKQFQPDSTASRLRR